ncbi:MAG: DUF1330 domain-containing protein [Leptolinea sp.]|nr:DUF1330 domain-containing protein [Leptolinea sp.]
MPKGYWIVSLDVTDPEKYKEYLASNGEAFKKYGARHLVRAGKYENPEGTSRSRNVVVEFPSYQAARDCYYSPEYQRALEFRRPVSTGDLIIIEGYEYPQNS